MLGGGRKLQFSDRQLQIPPKWGFPAKKFVFFEENFQTGSVPIMMLWPRFIKAQLPNTFWSI